MLTDAEKIHMHMRCFYNVLGGTENALDPQAGKAKYVYPLLSRDQINVSI